MAGNPRLAYLSSPTYTHIRCDTEHRTSNPSVCLGYSQLQELANFEAEQHRNCKENHQPTPSLLNVCGGLMIGSKESEIITGTLEAARVHHLPHEILTAQEISARYPVLTPDDEMVGVFETEAGVLIPEACIEAHCQMAEQHGAKLSFQESLVSWCVVKSGAEGVSETETEDLLSVVTDRNHSYLTRKLVLSVGAWAPEVYGCQIPVPLHAERRVLFWFRPSSSDEDDKAVGVESFKNIPVFLWDNSTEGNMCQFYGFPVESTGELSQAVKVARHQAIASTPSSGDQPSSAHCTPSSIDRQVYPYEIQYMQQVLEGKVPSLACGSVEAVETCLYTMTPDEHL